MIEEDEERKAINSYIRLLRKALTDGKVSLDERGLLDQLTMDLHLDRSYFKKLESWEYFRFRYLRLGDVDPKIKHNILNDVMEKDPENPYAPLYKGVLLYTEGALEEALEFFQKSLEPCLVLEGSYLHPPWEDRGCSGLPGRGCRTRSGAFHLLAPYGPDP